MCINCNIYAPINHAFCDIFGIPPNVYSTRSSLWHSRLGEYIRALRYETEFQERVTRSEIKNLHEYCVKHDLVQRLKDAYQADEIGFSITTNRTINYITFKYFKLQLSDDFPLSIPKELCALWGGSDDYFVCGKWVQVEHIPRDVVENHKLDAKYKQTAIDYGVQLLEDQVWYSKGNTTCRTEEKTKIEEKPIAKTEEKSAYSYMLPGITDPGREDTPKG